MAISRIIPAKRDQSSHRWETINRRWTQINQKQNFIRVHLRESAVHFVLDF
jgi:hypothetical protein